MQRLRRRNPELKVDRRQKIHVQILQLKSSGSASLQNFVANGIEPNECAFFALLSRCDIP